MLVPRHPRRFEAVAEWLRREQVPFARQSRADPVTEATQVLLVDAMGLLLDFYAAGDVAFVGGSLVPVGGHNLLEPAALASPDTHGARPRQCARSSAGAAGGTSGARGCAMPQNWGAPSRELLRDADARQRMGAQGLQVVAQGRGSCARVMALLPRRLAYGWAGRRATHERGK